MALSPLRLADELLHVQFPESSRPRQLFRTHLLLVGAALHAVAWRDSFGSDSDEEDLAIRLCLSHSDLEHQPDGQPRSREPTEFDLASLVGLVELMLRGTPDAAELAHQLGPGIQRPGP